MLNCKQRIKTVSSAELNGCNAFLSVWLSIKQNNHLFCLVIHIHMLETVSMGHLCRRSLYHLHGFQRITVPTVLFPRRPLKNASATADRRKLQLNLPSINPYTFQCTFSYTFLHILLINISLLIHLHLKQSVYTIHHYLTVNSTYQ